jgi:hypothetical protein
MATINDGELYLELPGATEEQMRRGLAAARAALNGVNMWASFDASWKPEYIDDHGRGEMTPAEWKLAEKWWAADRAAFDACGGRPGMPTTVGLRPYELHLEAQRNFAETLKRIPEARQDPPPDPGPHYTAALQESA